MSAEQPGVPRPILALLAVLLVACALPRVRNVLVTSPYPQHPDESRITLRAAGIVATGDLNPHFFKYPSLPIYLTAAVFAVGVELGGRAVDGVRGDPRWGDVGRVKAPYYGRPGVVLPARFLWVALSLATLALVGALARRALGEPSLTVLAPLALCASPLFLEHSWSYLNVDLLGGTAVVLALVVLFRQRGRTGLWPRAVLPGLLIGGAVGCKYYLGLLGLPFALEILRSERGPRLRQGLVLALVAALTFLATTPYSLLDRGKFLADLEAEMRHYREGHPGATADPGLPQLAFHLQVLRAQFGTVGGLLGLLGIAIALRRRRWATLQVLGVPLLLILYLSLQRTHFPRNALTPVVLLAPFVAYGGLLLARALPRRVPRPAAGALVLGLVTAGASWPELAPHLAVPLDSRRAALRWVLANVQPGTPVRVARRLGLDPRQLEPAYPVTVLGGRALFADGSEAVLILPSPPPAAAADFAELARFGRRALPDDPVLMLKGGDPRLVIVRSR